MPGYLAGMGMRGSMARLKSSNTMKSFIDTEKTELEVCDHSHHDKFYCQMDFDKLANFKNYNIKYNIANVINTINNMKSKKKMKKMKEGLLN